MFLFSDVSGIRLDNNSVFKCSVKHTQVCRTVPKYTELCQLEMCTGHTRKMWNVKMCTEHTREIRCEILARRKVYWSLKSEVICWSLQSNLIATWINLCYVKNCPSFQWDLYQGTDCHSLKYWATVVLYALHWLTRKSRILE